MGFHSNDNILIKIASGEVDAPESFNSPQLFARDVGLEAGDVEVPAAFIYYKYCLWCEATGNKEVPINMFGEAFKFKRRQDRKYLYYNIVDVFNYKENEEENKETLAKWQVNRERKNRASKRRRKSLKETTSKRVREQKKQASRQRANEKLRKKRRMLKEKEAQRKNEELPEESLIRLLDLKNGTSQE